MPRKAKKKTAAKTKPVRKKATTKKSTRKKAKAATRTAATDWRAAAIDRVRTLIRQAAPDAVEEVKWRKPSNAMKGVPVWSHNGIICTGETYKDKVKLTFAKGAALDDPAGLFNAGLGGGTRRAIDLREGRRWTDRRLRRSFGRRWR